MPQRPQCFRRRLSFNRNVQPTQNPVTGHDVLNWMISGMSRRETVLTAHRHSLQTGCKHMFADSVCLRVFYSLFGGTWAVALSCAVLELKAISLCPTNRAVQASIPKPTSWSWLTYRPHRLSPWVLPVVILHLLRNGRLPKGSFTKILYASVYQSVIRKSCLRGPRVEWVRHCNLSLVLYFYTFWAFLIQFLIRWSKNTTRDYTYLLLSSVLHLIKM
jgi:hypothetical protein